jgi:hypothetical protein
MPKRVQRPWIWRERPDNTVAVSRPTKFDNPFTAYGDRRTAVAQYRTWLEMPHALPVQHNGRTYYRPSPEDIASLRGKDLACYCPLDGPCHADVLLEWANR